MNIIEKIASLVIGIIVLAILIYAGINLFFAMAKAAFDLSPVSGIGFVASVLYVTYKGTLTYHSMLAIFIGTVISYAAGTLIPVFINNVLAGQFVAALVVAFVILYLRSEAQTIQK